MDIQSRLLFDDTLLDTASPQSRRLSLTTSQHPPPFHYTPTCASHLLPGLLSRKVWRLSSGVLRTGSRGVSVRLQDRDGIHGRGPAFFLERVEGPHGRESTKVHRETCCYRYTCVYSLNLSCYAGRLRCRGRHNHGRHSLTNICSQGLGVVDATEFRFVTWVFNVGIADDVRDSFSWVSEGIPIVVRARVHDFVHEMYTRFVNSILHRCPTPRHRDSPRDCSFTVPYWPIL